MCTAVVEYELVHVVAHISQQIFGLSETRSFLYLHIRLRIGVHVFLLSIQHHGATVLRVVLLRVVTRIHLHQQLAVDGAFSN